MRTAKTPTFAPRRLITAVVEDRRPAAQNQSLCTVDLPRSEGGVQGQHLTPIDQLGCRCRCVSDGALKPTNAADWAVPVSRSERGLTPTTFDEVSAD